MRTVTIMHHHSRVGKALRYISVNLHRSFTVEDLSRVACYAPYHFHRIFRQITGEPVHRYVRRLCLEVSAYHLLFTDDHIIHIALEAGYHSHEAYTRVFQQMYGRTPSRFRMRLHGPDVSSGALLVASKPDVSLVRRSLTERRLAFYPYFGPYARVAEEGRIAFADGNELNLLIEKDFVCLTERPNEDQADNFPHPDGDDKC